MRITDRAERWPTLAILELPLQRASPVSPDPHYAKADPALDGDLGEPCAATGSMGGDARFDALRGVAEIMAAWMRGADRLVEVQEIDVAHLRCLPFEQPTKHEPKGVGIVKRHDDRNGSMAARLVLAKRDALARARSRHIVAAFVIVGPPQIAAVRADAHHAAIRQEVVIRFIERVLPAGGLHLRVGQRLDVGVLQIAVVQLVAASGQRDAARRRCWRRVVGGGGDLGSDVGRLDGRAPQDFVDHGVEGVFGVAVRSGVPHELPRRIATVAILHQIVKRLAVVGDLLFDGRLRGDRSCRRKAVDRGELVIVAGGESVEESMLDVAHGRLLRTAIAMRLNGLDGSVFLVTLCD